MNESCASQREMEYKKLKTRIWVKTLGLEREKERERERERNSEFWRAK